MLNDTFASNCSAIHPRLRRKESNLYPSVPTAEEYLAHSQYPALRSALISLN